MAQMTKAFAENLLKRVKSGQHINTTVWEEEQLINGWLYWHEHVYVPRIEALARSSAAEGPPAGFGSGAASFAASSTSSTKEK